MRSFFCQKNFHGPEYVSLGEGWGLCPDFALVLHSLVQG